MSTRLIRSNSACIIAAEINQIHCTAPPYRGAAFISKAFREKPASHDCFVRLALAECLRFKAKRFGQLLPNTHQRRVSSEIAPMVPHLKQIVHIFGAYESSQKNKEDRLQDDQIS